MNALLSKFRSGSELTDAELQQLAKELVVAVYQKALVPMLLKLSDADLQAVLQKWLIDDANVLLAYIAFLRIWFQAENQDKVTKTIWGDVREEAQPAMGFVIIVAHELALELVARRFGGDPDPKERPNERWTWDCRVFDNYWRVVEPMLESIGDLKAKEVQAAWEESQEQYNIVVDKWPTPHWHQVNNDESQLWREVKELVDAASLATLDDGLLAVFGESVEPTTEDCEDCEWCRPPPNVQIPEPTN